MKMGAVLESLRAPTFTVVTAQEGVEKEKEKRSPHKKIKTILFFMDLPPTYNLLNTARRIGRQDSLLPTIKNYFKA
jgi:hypothetical protein